MYLKKFVKTIIIITLAALWCIFLSKMNELARLKYILYCWYKHHVHAFFIAAFTLALLFLYSVIPPWCYWITIVIQLMFQLSRTIFLDLLRTHLFVVSLRLNRVLSRAKNIFTAVTCCYNIILNLNFWTPFSLIIHIITAVQWMTHFIGIRSLCKVKYTNDLTIA